MEDSYLTIKTSGTCVFKDRGSKFLGFSFEISHEDEVKRNLEMLRSNYHDARHHCFGYRMGHHGELYRVNDDGEPSGSAGKPILNQIIGRNLTNVLVVVVRYFGGTLLGVGGLINAYRSAASEVLDNSGVTKKYIEDYFLIEFDYSQTTQVTKILKDPKVRIINQTFAGECLFKVSVLRSGSNKMIQTLNILDNLIISPLNN